MSYLELNCRAFNTITRLTVYVHLNKPQSPSASLHYCAYHNFVSIILLKIYGNSNFTDQYHQMKWLYPVSSRWMASWSFTCSLILRIIISLKPLWLSEIINIMTSMVNDVISLSPCQPTHKLWLPERWLSASIDISGSSLGSD